MSSGTREMRAEDREMRSKGREKWLEERRMRTGKRVFVSAALEPGGQGSRESRTTA